MKALRSYIERCLPSPPGTLGIHRTRTKVVVNTALRLVQLWCTDRPWLLASVFEGEAWTGRYELRRVRILPP